MSTKKLVVYFSAGGTTAKVAEKIAEAAGADLFEIVPKVPYTEADLDWMNDRSRSTLEMKDPLSRPSILNMVDGMEKYDVVFIGFPIWWYTAPTIIKTFLESYDFSGKTIAPFATSGSSDVGKTLKDLVLVCPSAKRWFNAKRFENNVGKDELVAWLEQLERE